MKKDLRVRVSKYMSYLLRHNPDGLVMDKHGYVNLNDLIRKVREKFPWVDEAFIREVVEGSEKQRFEIRDEKIRALYGHSISVDLGLEEDNSKRVLYHGTTPEAASRILKEGLKPMGRRWVHLSSTVEVAREVGYRRTRTPVILEIDVERARKDGLRFYRATDKVYLCREIPPEYIRRVEGRKTEDNYLDTS